MPKTILEIPSKNAFNEKTTHKTTTPFENETHKTYYYDHSRHYCRANYYDAAARGRQADTPFPAYAYTYNPCRH